MNAAIPHDAWPVPAFVRLVPFAAACLLYLAAAGRIRRKGQAWPLRRIVCWTAGLLCGAAAVAGPLGERAHAHFAIHMLAHLLLGMLAPLLLMLGAPVTLLLRALNKRAARFAARMLGCRAFRLPTHPVPAAVLNIGGLWLLYTTPLYSAMQHMPVWHLLVHVHLLAAGCLFTLSIFQPDPAPHQAGFFARASVLLAAIAGHDILAKRLYAHPPAGVPPLQAETGAMLMYYGGDAVDLVLIALVLGQRFRSRRRGTAAKPAPAGPDQSAEVGE